MRLHKLLCIMLAALIFLTPFCIVRANETSNQEINNDLEFYKEIIRSETDYIKSLMLGNGALPKTTASKNSEFASKDLPNINGISDEVYKTWDVGHVVPYFSEIAILGLMKASPDDSQATVKRFIEWYFNSLNTAESDMYGVDGTIYDYYVFQNPSDSNQTVQITARDLHMDEFENAESNPYNYDSTDSYAALFLAILYEYYNIYDDADTIVDQKFDIGRVVNALLATYDDSLNLTYAKPGYAVYYLMDNCEVYYGLKAASALYSEAFDDSKTSQRLNNYANKIKAAIEEHLWVDEEQIYISGIYANKEPISNIFDYDFYPNATAQLYPIVYGLIEPDSERAEAIYTRFNNVYGVEGKDGHDWTALDKGDDFPWCLIATASVMVGDYERADRFFTALNEKFLNTHTYPYYNAEAGQTLLAVSLMIEPKSLIGVKEEIITAGINDEIDLGLILSPDFSDPGRVDVKVKDDSIAIFDKNSGKLKTLSAGQTNINVTVGDNTLMIVLNVADSNISNNTVAVTSDTQNTQRSFIYGLVIAIVIISVVIGFVVYLYRSDRKKNKS